MTAAATECELAHCVGFHCEPTSKRVHRCAECNLFDTDEDAAHAVVALIEILTTLKKASPGVTVADLLDELERRAEYVRLDDRTGLRLKRRR